VLYNNEWREATPLARAEWIRFVAVFFGKLDTADSIFAEVESAYCTLRDHQSNNPSIHQSVSVLSGLDFRGTWYVPAGGTYMGALFKDAGAAYAFADDERESSIPLTFEQALLTFADADVWLGCNVPSRQALLEMNSQHALFKAYKTGRLYNFRKRCLPSGANDFWESGVVHPERILQDIIATLNGDTTFYYINPVR
jgi:iron complex transport system substrate-binding protein